jgi:hypothetical protein
VDEEIIANMRARVQQLRRVVSLAHDQRIIEVLQQVIDSGEGDIRKVQEAIGCNE